jgi:glycosyltransferase involved in cell wall biosynthesis
MKTFGFYAPYLNHPGIKVIHGYLPRKELIKYYNMSHVLVQPSLREGFGLHLYEGMKAGCRIITTDHAPMNEIKHDGNYFIPVRRQEPKAESFIPLCYPDENILTDTIIKMEI